MNRMIWITFNPVDKSVRIYHSREFATSESLRLNSMNKDHPSFRLYSMEWSKEGEMKYEGRLFRRFGEEFDRKDPWNKVD